MQSRFRVGLFLSLMLLVTTATEGHDNWNQFRGPHGDGKSLATNLPIEFSETKNVRWKTPIHDRGWSSPVVWSDQIWLTSGREDGKELYAICVDLYSGEVIHDIKIFDVPDPSMEWSDQNRLRRMFIQNAIRGARPTLEFLQCYGYLGKRSCNSPSSSDGSYGMSRHTVATDRAGIVIFAAGCSLFRRLDVSDVV